MRIGVYPGSFDPATLGHLDIIQRASKLFDKLIVAAMINGEKTSAFTMEEKVDFLKRMTADLPNVEVECFSGLLADYVREKNACAIVPLIPAPVLLMAMCTTPITEKLTTIRNKRTIEKLLYGGYRKTVSGNQIGRASCRERV